MGDNGIFKSRVEWEVVRSWLEAKRQDEEDRQNAANVRLAIYHDAWRDVLDGALRELFVPANYANIRMSANTSQNLTKKVVNELAMVYKRPASRSLRDANGEQLSVPAFDNLDYDGLMDLVNKYTILLNDVGVLVSWDGDRQQVRLSLLTPANTSVFQRDGWPEDISGFMYRVDEIDSPMSDKPHYYVYWDDEQHYVVDGDGNRRDPSPDGSNPDMVNPYGVMPVVWVHKALRPGMFWDPDDGSDIIDGTLKNGIKRTLKDYAFKMQSFKQPWIRNPAGQIPAEIAMDPAKVWLLGPEGDVGYMDMTADFAAIDAAIANDIDGMLSAYGISSASFAAQEAESGVALEIKNRTLRELREKQIDIFRKAEGELFEIIRTVNNTWNAEQIPEAAQFSVDFAEPEVYTGPMAQREQALWDMEHGLISPAQFYVRFNPDVDEAVAAAMIQDNMEAYNRFRDAGFVAPEATGAETVEE